MASIASILTIAESHVDEAEMLSSAKLCLSDARVEAALGNDERAKAWALRSLSYSVGVFHADYQRAAA